MSEPTGELNRSAIGRLIDELSWAGRSIRDYRGGGVGYENVLVAEVMLALDFLPRTAFLGAVIQAATGADAARGVVVRDLEEAEVLVLPPEVFLRPSGATYQEKLVVQPDATIAGAGSLVLVEAKRIRPGSFQAEQLAREYVALLREGDTKIPLLLLLLPSGPPVPVAGHGRMEIPAAVELYLSSVLSRAEGHSLESKELVERVPQVFAWITWQQIADVIRRERDEVECLDASQAMSIRRLADFALDAVIRHGLPRPSTER